MNILIMLAVFVVVVGFWGPKEECKNTPCKCRECIEKV